MKPSSLVKKIVLVTGGNHGIGLEICRQLCSHISSAFNFHVICTSRNSLSNAKQELSCLKDNGNSIDFVEMDIGNNESINNAFNYVSKTYGNLDILINNAGIANKDSQSTNTFNYNIVKNTFDINYYATINVTQTFIKLLDKDKNIENIENIKKEIIFLSSRAGAINKIGSKSFQNELLSSDLTFSQLDDIMNQFIVDVKKLDNKEIDKDIFDKQWWQSGYGMSKIGISQYSRLLARDNVSTWVGAYCPGWCKTNMTGMNSHAPRTAAQGAIGVTMLATQFQTQKDTFAHHYQSGRFWAVDFNGNKDAMLHNVDWYDCKVPRR